MRKISLAFLLLAALLASAPHATAADEPLVPITAFVTNPKAAWDHRVSPDGTRIAWIAMRGGKATLHVRKLAESAGQAIKTPREARPPWPGAESFTWSRDGKRILFVMDRNGDENTHLYAVDVEATEPVARDLTPLEGVRVELVRPLANEPEIAIVRHNGRTGRLFDLYRVNIATGASTILQENPGDVCGWSVNNLGRIRARFLCAADGGWVLEVPDGLGDFRKVVTGSYGDGIRIAGYPINPRYAWALSNRGRERSALVRLDLRDGREDVIYEHPSVDIYGAHVQETGQLGYLWTWPGMQEWRFFDGSLQADLTPVLERERSALRILSEDRARRWLTYAVETDRGDAAVYLMDRASGERTLLSASAMEPYRDRLAAMEPMSFTARDGLTIPAHLTLPKGANGPGPMVVLVHGGPWAQDHWGYSTTAQFLANRGYAVLQINYRGSVGYGRKLFLAGTREFARKMHDDLIDGVRWAVARGIADEKRVAIMGTSYGGYSTLSGLAFTPDVFVAGVDRVGISDMVSLIEDWPAYWRAGDMGFWHRFFADPRKEDERRMLADRSPLTHAGAIKAPLLVIQGANDVRVKRDQSDRIVEALKARSHPVEYILFADEGHGINRASNQLAYLRAVEIFLARHLGGRDGGEPRD